MRKLYTLWMVLLPITVAAIVLYIEDNILSETEIIVTDQELPEAFDGYKIVHLSDLHSKWFGEDQKRLIERVEEQNPDLIVFTGDLLDRSRNQLEPGVTLLTQLKNTAPVYFVTGNHERGSGKTKELIEELEAQEVHVLRNESLELQRKGEVISLAGVEDPTFSGSFSERVVQTLSGESYTILLSHRPEFFSLYQEQGADLVFSGHAHGGQFRVPFIGGLVAPGQGVFPAYTSGKHEEVGTTMIVSRGLGNSIFPQRLFNRPEIVSVELKK
ncbi:metallophosphoesterase [Halobacillus litoralis]|uniref:metallophosphoesterase n=1 Tax=Halobacillus litoralis TaxID=45668 RepID=UPI001CD54803|nr:metallophosphoesterase [Halobacillus litoralis]MCA0972118.1 metallophosphoesterase [Halobacillus litoralis]